ncbi:hypothetical protein EJ110_NYTH07654 [Nymphaea thermarum]|nr:hypothetical protein EJ110_NYTH07654 [Nymphaea thermarum]
MKQAHTKAAEEGVRKDRKSGTGLSGEPKKGGHGGKFTWWGDEAALRRLQEEGEQLPVDPKDPNYEDPEDDDDQA